MNKEQQDAYDKAQVMLAYARGEAVEFRFLEDDDWENCLMPRWEWADFNYRIKPKEREYWVFKDHKSDCVQNVVFKSKKECEEWFSDCEGEPIRLVKA